VVLVGNGRLYGGPIPIFHQADLRDGLLDVCVLPQVNWLVLARYACAYVSPRLLFPGRRHYFQADSLTVESASPAPLELDGEHVGCTPARFSVRRAALRVIVP
jgi:diacylglycerol kinase family enzyme